MEEKTPKNNKKKLLIGAAFVLAVVGYAVSAYLRGRAYETTDNAQIDGDLMPVRAGVAGYISAIRFTDNQEVKAGDTLIVFNTAELRAEVNRITAELENARLNVVVSSGLAHASVQNATAAAYEAQSGEQAVESARATYDRTLGDLERGKQLLAIKAMTQTAYEQLQTQADVARALYLKAKASQQSSLSSFSGLKTRAITEEKQIAMARNTLLQKEAELEAARERYRHAFVIAPFDGIVTKRNVQAGQFIGIGQALCAIINHQHLWVTANFKETQLHKIKAGQTVDVSVDAYEDVELTGAIESFCGATGAPFALVPPDNATGNFIKIAQRFPVRIRLNNRAGHDALYPGLSAFVKVKVN